MRSKMNKNPPAQTEIRMLEYFRIPFPTCIPDNNSYDPLPTHDDAPFNVNEKYLKGLENVWE